MISGLRRGENEIVALLGGYIALVIGVSGQPIGPIFRGPIYCPEMSVTNYTSTLRNIPEWRRSQDLCGHAYLACAGTHTDTHTHTHGQTHNAVCKAARNPFDSVVHSMHLTNAACSAPSFSLQSFNITGAFGFSSLHSTVSFHRPLPMRHVFPQSNCSYFLASTCAGQQLSAIILTYFYRTNCSALTLFKTKYLNLFTMLLEKLSVLRNAASHLKVCIYTASDYLHCIFFSPYNTMHFKINNTIF